MKFTNDRRKKDLAAIHILKKELSLTDTTYRRVLRSLVGQTSSKGMTAAERYKVRVFLKREKSSRDFIEARAKREYHFPEKQRRFPERRVSDEEALRILGPS
jgi:phage gp16-like protein